MKLLLPWRRSQPPEQDDGGVAAAERALAESRARLARAQAEQRRHAELRDRNNVTQLVRQLIDKHAEEGHERGTAAG